MPEAWCAPLEPLGFNADKAMLGRSGIRRFKKPVCRVLYAPFRLLEAALETRISVSQGYGFEKTGRRRHNNREGA